MDSLKTAKTIDLVLPLAFLLIQCNDPLTKTPKLTRAKRIPEWTTYDAQVAEMAERLLKKDAERKGDANAPMVDESMFTRIDSVPQKEDAVQDGKARGDERVKDEL